MRTVLLLLAMALPAHAFSKTPAPDPLQRRLVARATLALAARYDFGPLHSVVLRHAIRPADLGRPDIAMLARRPTPTDQRGIAPSAMMLGGLLAASMGTAASPYEMVGPDCGFGYTTGLSWTDHVMGQGRDPTSRCVWGDWQDHVPKDAPMKDAEWPMKR